MYYLHTVRPDQVHRYDRLIDATILLSESEIEIVFLCLDDSAYHAIIITPTPLHTPEDVTRIALRTI